MSIKLILVLLIARPSSSAYYNGHSNASVSADSRVSASVSGTERSNAAQKWLAADRALREASVLAVKSVMSHALKVSESLNLTSDCSRGLFQFLIGIKQTKLWAFRMLDSFGKIPNGVFSGSLSSLGDYDLCINTDIPGGKSRGQYCTVDIVPPLPQRERFVAYDVIIPEFVNITPPDSATTQMLKMARVFYHLRFRTSVCIPSTCTRKDVEKIAADVLQMMKLEFEVTIPNCETKLDQVVFDSSQIAIITLLSTLLLVAIVATMMDAAWHIRNNEEALERTGLPFKCLMCFSLSRNLQRLLKKDDSKDSIKIFHGIKVTVMIWIILNHTYLFFSYQAMSSLLLARVMAGDILFQIVPNGVFAVQPFFFISAALSAYGVLKLKRDLNVFMFIFRRIWRLLPTFMLVIACTFLIPHLGSGPVWKETVVDGITEKCRLNWWTNLLFVNNFVSLNEMCLRWTWYIPVDTQLYVLGLIVLIPLKKNPRWGLGVNFVLLCTAIIVSAALHIYHKIPPAFIPLFDHPDDIARTADYGYHRTYLHCGTYCVGLTVGYILTTKPKTQISLWINKLGWFVAFFLAVILVYGAYDWMQGHLPNLVVSTLYASTSRFMFSLVLAWITLSCMAGYGGIVTSFLSWDGFVPLGRLTYMTYLVHPLIIYMYVGSTRTLIRHDHRTLVFQFLATVVMSFMVALPLGLLFESPFLALERVLISKRELRDNKNGDSCPRINDRCNDPKEPDNSLNGNSNNAIGMTLK